MSKKKVPAKKSQDSMAAEALLASLFPEAIAQKVKELIVKDVLADGYLMQAIRDKFDVEESASAKAKAKGYSHVELDKDEKEVGKEFIIKAAKSLKIEPRSLRSWIVTVDGVDLAPKEVYRRAFTLAGYKVDWDFTTYKALSWLEHHGFSIQKLG